MVKVTIVTLGKMQSQNKSQKGGKCEGNKRNTGENEKKKEERE